MITPKWQPDTPMNTVIFDCDGTLSTLEGIDVLAEHNSVGPQVVELTHEAMARSGMCPELYEQRLRLVKPTHDQVISLGNEYYVNRVEDADAVIQIFKRLKKSIYIVSAGLRPAVKLFGKLLDVLEENIIAVNIEFDSQGRYMQYDHHSPLTFSNGKRAIISELKNTHPRIAFIGDGINDLEAKDLADRFIGFGGKFYRANIEAQCEYYIKSMSLTPVLALILTHAEYQQLLPAEKMLYDKGVGLIEEGKVKV